ncbi:hypothetical protein D9611_001577 [Ephemerocybe angulata]|uniref:Ph domain-containing protein n=1 Tax=Ephemerocybe angulata TaxID=980116 RepID=A0A8H5CJN3_9AGAR|nr:hypothetical protein D9611_001577 [Tulosesus angulatus]
MSALLGKAGKKLFEQHLESYAPADPLYENYTDDRGRQKRRKRELPPGLSARDAAILRSVKKRAHYLDKGFSLCGMRFGWTFFISLIPIVGDITDATLNYYLVVRKARKADLPPWLLSRMMLNNAISLAVSFVPFAGDLVLAMFKANSRNAALLEEFLRIRGEEYLKLHPGEVEAAAPANRKGKGTGFWFRKKSPARGDLTKADAEQVKPGAGVKPGEVIEEVRAMPPGPQTSAALGAHANLGHAESSAPPSGGSNGGRSFTSFFSRSRRQSGEVDKLMPSNANRGSRFIENVSNSSAAPSTTA